MANKRSNKAERPNIVFVMAMTLAGSTLAPTIAGSWRGEPLTSIS